MGKLLQKLVNGIVPSWLTKVKSSAESSPRKLLPFFRAGGNHPSSKKSPSSVLSTPPPPNPTGVLALVDKKSTPQSDSSPVDMYPSLSSTQKKEPEAEKSDNRHIQHEESHPFVDVKEHNHFEKVECMQADDMQPQSQSGYCINADHPTQLHVYNCSKESLLKIHDRELQHIKQEDIHLHSQEDQYDYGYHENAYRELLGFKRKSRSLQSEEVNKDEDEDEEEGGNIARWAWKRRKGEEGMMSCGLPESICCIVGNSKAVVKQSLEPHIAVWESMVEMIVGNGLWELGNLEFLLYCYLSLNEPHLHPIIQSSFLQVLKDLERIS